ncbi:hypothetical protein [Pseudomonas syringae]|uniref:Fe-S cluster assembly scaffold protein SufB n=1 Tax=Pseudomonas syringae pv. actinidiae TaxID=103796 RepID=A0A2V0Q7T3_PSESF|nr:hypothetical protein [Pseudomonas syringae]EPN01076.1 hypothetical protein A259_28034 [Pseudomonas syringae pv. actinidiae ICMP 19070]AQL36733.1 hypothetical protein JN853_09920 [Pseudomonas syringae pv. actinidiae ICMP 9853]EGH68008.1 hypothetical protein PSYAC_24508 [Pseudomonas syringae pv. actinidiae str. M302091]EPM55924.1 hypothetical protein A256_06839 [Pseudomonas syringae pv. actinidiae ICMP 19103]EPM57072.1 hypothetical protein A264_20828 [Pseudomonas syringae pv. actinidiae ICMP 
MFDKQVYELKIEDLTQYEAWFFPMDDTAEDELTVRPLTRSEQSTDYQIIVRTTFSGKDGSQYLGYLYWDSSEQLEYLKPVILLEDGTAISFWDGMTEPSWENYSEHAKKVRKSLPLSYKSEALSGMPEISGIIEGLGYLDNDKVSWVS